MEVTAFFTSQISKVQIDLINKWVTIKIRVNNNNNSRCNNTLINTTISSISSEEVSSNTKTITEVITIKITRVIINSTEEGITTINTKTEVVEEEEGEVITIGIIEINDDIKPEMKLTK